MQRAQDERLSALSIMVRMSSDRLASLTLDYAPKQRPRGRTWLKRIVLILVVMGVGAMAWRYTSSLLSSVESWYWQKRCLAFNAAPDIVAYWRSAETKPSEHASEGFLDSKSPLIPYSPLLCGFGTGNASTKPTRLVGGLVPKPYAMFLRAESLSIVGTETAVVFCHERSSASGHRRLVVVEYNVDNADVGSMIVDEMKPIIYCRDGSFLSQESYWSSFTAEVFPGPSRIYAGQPDASDNSHLTIAFDWADGVNGTIDGWLQDDDSLTLKIREGAGTIEATSDRYLMRRLEGTVKFKNP